MINLQRVITDHTSMRISDNPIEKTNYILVSDAIPSREALRLEGWTIGCSYVGARPYSRSPSILDIDRVIIETCSELTAL